MKRNGSVFDFETVLLSELLPKAEIENVVKTVQSAIGSKDRVLSIKPGNRYDVLCISWQYADCLNRIADALTKTFPNSIAREAIVLRSSDDFDSLLFANAF